MTDQRRQNRLDWDAEIGVEWGGEIRTARTRNIGIGGLSADMSAPPHFDARITVHLRLPWSKDALRIPSVVRWSRPEGGFGAQFVSLRALEVWGLARLVQQLDPGEEA